MRFIGKRYTGADSVNGSFSGKWDEWFENDWFADIQNQYDFYEDANAHIGLCRILPDESFEYWIGEFAPAGHCTVQGAAQACIDLLKRIDEREGINDVCWQDVWPLKRGVSYNMVIYKANIVK